MTDSKTETFGLLLHDAGRLLRARFEARAKDMGLSSAQWRLLIRLFREGPVPQARLAECMEIEPISVSRLVDRMATAGWVERQKSPTDRRVHIVAPTPKALNTVAEIKKIADALYAEALAGLADDERAGLMAALRTVVNNLSTSPDAAGPREMAEGTEE